MNGITLFQAFPVVDLPGFMDGLPEGNWPAVFGDLFEPGSPAVGKHEVRLGDPQFLLFLPRFHRVWESFISIDANSVSIVSRICRTFAITWLR